MFVRALVVALVVALGGCSPQVTDREPDAAETTPWLDGYAYRRAIELAPPATGAVADVPLAIASGEDAALAAHVGAGGGDLVVTAGDGTTVLASEVVGFDGATGALEIWARAPMLDGPNQLYLYYGGAGTAADPTRVWADYAGVWHLSEQGTGARDSTSRAHNLVASPGEPMRASGIAGSARIHDGIDDGLAIADPADDSLDFATASVSYSVWVRETAAVDLYDTPFYKGGTALSQPGYCLLLGSGAWGAKIHDSAKSFDAAMGSEVKGGWRHLVAVIDREAKQFRAYVDGVKTDTVDISTLGSLATSEPFEIGRSATQPFRGAIDEVRIYAGVLSEARIAAEYANLASGEFLAIRGEQAR